MSGTWRDTLLVVTEKSSVKELHLSAISVAPCVIYGLVWQASVQLKTSCTLAFPYVPARTIDNIRPSVIIRNPDTSARTAEKKPCLSLPHYLLYLCVYVRAPGRCCRDERPRGHQLRMRPHLCWEMERQAFQRMVNDARCWDSGEMESFGGLGIRASRTGQFGRNHLFLKLALWTRQAAVSLMTPNAAAKKTLILKWIQYCFASVSPHSICVLRET